MSFLLTFGLLVPAVLRSRSRRGGNILLEPEPKFFGLAPGM
jgi:hypothetical protein